MDFALDLINDVIFTGYFVKFIFTYSMHIRDEKAAPGKSGRKCQKQ